MGFADVPDTVRSRRVVFRRFGGPEVLEVESRPVPVPAPGQVRVRVAAAGVNPVDWKLFSGRPMHDAYERHLPSGNGYDFAGTVDALGSGVTGWEVGDRVFGGLRYEAQADHLVIDPAGLVDVPAGLPLTVAGALNVVGRTAWASVASQDVGPGTTVLVSGASGGVGVLTAGLCRLRGARVIGTASPGRHDVLRARGIEPVAYGSGLVDRLRTVAPGGIDVVLDTVGHGTVESALELGVQSGRINTVADYAARGAHGVRGVGGADAGVDELGLVAGLLAAGDLELPIDAEYDLVDVRAAYVRSMGGHAAGKIVLRTDRG
ncbi:NADP-dependent oxidoreductase [Curtobacterium pusillum]|uniref:NADP-dependent oxidoreductase n=1 Tax=Curtobacterium pusillum TaxID=69373 RepID=UPI00381D8DFA